MIFSEILQVKMLLLLCCVIATPLLASSGVCNSLLNVHYDGETDRLTVQGENASLQKVLAVIALQSGIEIGMAPEAEKLITLDFENAPLEEGLKKMARQLNLSQAMYYGKASGDMEPLLTGMKVVPTGKAFDDAMPVVDLKQEAVYRGRSKYPRKNLTQPLTDQGPETPGAAKNVPRLRWEERIKSLPEAKRTEIETLMVTLTEKREERKAAIREKREKRRAERELRRQEHREKRDFRNADD